MLGCAASDVSVVTGDTRRFNWGAGTYASRALVVSGNAMHVAAVKVRDKALRLAASLLEVSPDDLEAVDGTIRVKGAPATALTLGALATAANPIRYAYGKEASDAALRLVKPRAGAVLADGEEPGLEAVGYYAPPHSTFASGCHAVIVDVDVATGHVGHLETPSPLNPLGVKGVGEAGAIPGPAVVAEAIEDALAPLGV